MVIIVQDSRLKYKDSSWGWIRKTKKKKILASKNKRFYVLIRLISRIEPLLYRSNIRILKWDAEIGGSVSEWLLSDLMRDEYPHKRNEFLFGVMRYLRKWEIYWSAKG